MSRQEDFENYYDKYLEYEEEFTDLIKRLDKINGVIQKEEFLSEHDFEVIDAANKVPDIYDEIRDDFKIAFREKDASTMYMLVEKYNRWNEYLRKLIHRYEREHEIEFRKKKSSKPRQTRKPIKKTIKKVIRRKKK